MGIDYPYGIFFAFVCHGGILPWRNWFSQGIYFDVSPEDDKVSIQEGEAA